MISFRSRPRQLEKPSLVDRMRWGRGRSRYWLFVLVLSVVGAGLLLISPPRRPGLVPPEPAEPGPQWRLLETIEQPLGSIERLTVRAVVPAGLSDSALQLALDRLLYTTLEMANRRQRRRVRVVWAYLVESDSARPMQWRAMAIWTDPGLSRSLRPAGIGGDAVRIGNTEYDFTNPVGPAGRPEGESDDN